MSSLPAIAIVGRPNVGKSSLLNALVRKRVSIVQDMPGVTRDRVSTPLHIAGRWVELVDTGGFGFDDPDKLSDHIEKQIRLAVGRARLVLFVVDAQAGLASADQTIAKLLREQGLRVVILANKADGPKTDSALADFARLGLGTPHGVSAKTGRGIAELESVITNAVDLSDAPTELPENDTLIAIVGKRNAGKSTLVNAVARAFEEEGAGPSDDRVIVSEVPGTTRDSVDVAFAKDGKHLTVIDTAGVRKKRHMVTNDIEFYSFHRAQRSIRRADVVFLLLDASQKVAEPDKKLAQYIIEQMKPVVIVLNKWDVVLQQLEAGELDTNDAAKLMQQFEEYLEAELPGLDFAPIAFVTATDGRNVSSLIDQGRHLHKQATQRLGTGQLNAALKQVFLDRPPSSKSGRTPRIYYATQVSVGPPTVVLFVNNPAYFDTGYRRYVVNRMRELLPFADVPIKLEVRRRSGGTESERPSTSPATAGEATRGRPPGPSRRPGAGGKKAVKRKVGQKPRK